MSNSISIEIDEGSGFCFGVVNAIRKVEEALKEEKNLYCLGDIVHNNMEMTRLEKLGLKTIHKPEYDKLKNNTVLLRAHGEPPLTYATAKENDIKLIDATCPVVLRLQRSVNMAYKTSQKDQGQVVIYGKKGHAEVIGLEGQTDGKAIVLESIDDIGKVDLNRPIRLFSQTTMMVDKFIEIKSFFEKNISDKNILEVHNSICRQVSGRIDALHSFSRRNDVIIFVSGKKSSNGKALFSECKKVNNQAYMIATTNEINKDWFQNVTNIGICGATSTPDWLMKEVSNYIKKILS